MRGEAYYIMADYQKDGYKKAKLSEQSMKIFNKILEDDFKEEMLQQYVKSDAQYILSIYCLIDVRNIMNYNNLIGVKVDYLMNLPTDAEETKLRLKELNILRRDYAVQMLTFEKFAKKNTDVCAHEHLMTTYLNIATQFRSIILSHQKNLQHNLDRSNTFLMQFVDLSKSDPETIDLFTLPNAYILAVGALAERIDKDLFIKKFRKDFTTDS